MPSLHMLGTWRRKKNPTFWNSRKLLLCYEALHLADQKSYSIHDFLIPHQYPISSRTADWEAFRTFYCLLHLKGEGITVKDIRLDKACVGLFDFEPAQSGSPKLYQYFLEKLAKYVPLTISRSRYLKYIPDNYQADSLIQDKQAMKDGNGDIWQQPGVPFDQFAFPFILPAFFTFGFDINQKVLKKALNTYISQYREDVLLLPDNNYFGFAFAKNVFEALIDRLAFRQTKRTVLTFRSNGKKKKGIHDEFTEVFQEKFPKEYTLWEQGTYHFPFWETMFALEQAGKLRIYHLSAKRKLPCPEEPNPNLSWHGIDQQPLSLTLEFALILSKESLDRKGKKIELIEIGESDSDTFPVFINQNYVQTLTFSRKTKLGNLLYTIAREGYLEYDKSLKKTLEYSADKRCKLFSKTEYVASKLFEIDDDGYIIPVPGVRVKWVENKPT